MVTELNRVSEIQVIYRPEFKANLRPQVGSAIDAYEIFIEHWNKERIEYNEEFKVMLLNRENRVLGIATISVGGVSGTVVDPKIIFAIALKCNASALILAHNHPSGNLQPSESDKVTTRKLVEGGKLLDIAVCDHLIIANDGFNSFADNGLI
jgi:DNA repair protein RadC